MIAKSERKRDAERKRAARKSANDLTIPKIKNPARKRRTERDIFSWLTTYFPDSFYREFTAQQKQIVEEILLAAKYGGDKAIAAPRSDGKTTIAECVILFCMLTGLLRFPVIVAATGPDAARILKHLKNHLERNDLLAEDYPEVCHPIRALEGAPQRAGSQTVRGRRTYLEWKEDYVVLPTVARSRASGSAVTTRGLDAAIRGVRIGVMRPDFVLIDDPETRESVKSEEQTKGRRLTIEQDLAGLGGGDKKLSRVMLTTIMRRATDEGNPTISFEYTDPQQKPSWQGRRMRLLSCDPEREDLWEEYISLRRADFQGGDMYARRSHAFYELHRNAMDAGAIVTNETRYDPSLLPDGTQSELSALQRCYNIIADRGREAFLTEYQNDPPEIYGPVESGIAPSIVQRRISGIPRCVIPTGATVLSHGVDIGKWKLHWVVRAWLPSGIGHTIDYGRQDVYDVTYGSDEGLGRAIRAAILRRMEEFHGSMYCTEDGQMISDPITLVDSSYRTDDVYAACVDAGSGVFPVMGFGESVTSIARIRFSSEKIGGKVRAIGDHWKLIQEPGSKVRRIDCSADYWKAWEHDRWMTGLDKPGHMLLFGEPSEDKSRLSIDERSHGEYAQHICAEVEIEEPFKGSIRRRWKNKSKENHWLDASYYASVGASIRGFSLPGVSVRSLYGSVPRSAVRASPERKSLAQMAAGK